MPKLRSIYPIGIDITDHDVYAAQIRDSRRGPAIRGLFHRELKGDPAKDPEGVLGPVIEEISGYEPLSGKRVALHLPSKALFSFPLRLRLLQGEVLEEVILRESKEYLPFPVEKAVLDYPSILPQPSLGPNHYKAIIVAVSREELEQYLQVLTRAGFHVETVDSVICSLIRLHGHLQEITDNPAILCHIGNSGSLLTVFRKGGILAERSVAWGIQALLRKLMINLELEGDPHKAQSLLREFGLAHENRQDPEKGPGEEENPATEDPYRVMYQVLTPYIEELIGHFHSIIGYLKSEEPDSALEGIYLYGQGNLIRYLGEYIERRVNIQTRSMNVLKHFLAPDGLPSFNGTGNDPFALALALSMRKVTWL